MKYTVAVYKQYINMPYFYYYLKVFCPYRINYLVISGQKLIVHKNNKQSFFKYC